jgi:hypothetical protein
MTQDYSGSLWMMHHDLAGLSITDLTQDAFRAGEQLTCLHIKSNICFSHDQPENKS